MSNEYAGAPVQIGEAHVAVAGEGSKIVSGTDRAITFGGQAKATIPPGASLVSDPVELPVDALGQISVSVYLPQETPLSTFHWDGKQTAYIGDGNQTASEAVTAAQTTDARILLSEILVDARQMRAPSSPLAIRSPTAPAPRWMPTTAGPISLPRASPQNG